MEEKLQQELLIREINMSEKFDIPADDNPSKLHSIQQETLKRKELKEKEKDFAELSVILTELLIQEKKLEEEVDTKTATRIPHEEFVLLLNRVDDLGVLIDGKIVEKENLSQEISRMKKELGK